MMLIWKKFQQSKYYLDPSKADSVYSHFRVNFKNLETGRIQTFGETEAASKKKMEKIPDYSKRKMK